MVPSWIIIDWLGCSHRQCGTSLQEGYIHDPSVSPCILPLVNRSSHPTPNSLVYLLELYMPMALTGCDEFVPPTRLLLQTACFNVSMAESATLDLEIQQISQAAWRARGERNLPHVTSSPEFIRGVREKPQKHTKDSTAHWA